MTRHQTHFFIVDVSGAADEIPPFVQAEFCDRLEALEAGRLDENWVVVELDGDGVPALLDAVPKYTSVPEFTAAVQAWREGDDRVYGAWRALRDAEYELARVLDP